MCEIYLSYCLNCNKEIQNTNKKYLKKFCSNECQYEYRWSKNIKNKRFGMLIALERVNKNKWKCICDCGKYTTVKTTHLTNGTTKSCGCLASSIHRNNIKNNKKIDNFKNNNFKFGTNLASISNSKPQKNNKLTGIKGVYLKKEGVYIAQLQYKGTLYRSKTTTDIEEAIKYRKDLEEKYFKSILDKHEEN